VGRDECALDKKGYGMSGGWDRCISGIGRYVERVSAGRPRSLERFSKDFCAFQLEGRVCDGHSVDLDPAPLS